MSHLDRTTLRTLLDYDQKSGRFTWRVRMSQRVLAGSEAGKNDARGYRIVKIRGRSYKAHRLAFLWMTGELPNGEVDHRNGDPSDNSWKNRRKSWKRSATGFLGVTESGRSSNPFKASIHVAGRNVYLGCYPTKERAQTAYLIAKRVFHLGNTL